jgi:hypothetical protein
MKPSDHPHSNHPAPFHSPRVARDVRAEDEACAPDFATHPRLSADVLTPLARHNAWPNRVHSRLGLVFRLGLLSTHPRGHAVTLGYQVVARFNWNWTFTVWFHGFINARRAGLRPARFGILPNLQNPGGTPIHPPSPHGLIIGHRQLLPNPVPAHTAGFRIRYPTPRTVSMMTGAAGSASIFRRSCAMC